MKTLLLVLTFLSVTVACDDKKESKTCIINGVERDWSVCEQKNNPQRPEENPQQTPIVRLDASVTVPIHLDEQGNLEFLENKTDIARSGRYECEMNINMGETAKLRRSGTTLIVTDKDGTTHLSKVGSRDDGFYGGWKKTDQIENGYVELYVTIYRNQTATFTQRCFFR